MTLAPERNPSHGSTKPQGINPRLRVESDTPRPQRPAYKKSGRPNPAAHLTPEQIEGLGHELDALRKEVMDSRGARDAAYIRKVIKAQRYLEVGSRAVLLFSNVKVKGIRPAWWIGTAGLSVAKILENMEIGHNVMHGQWDWMRDPKIHSTAWEWDNASPSSQWKHSHNEIHHTFTNVLGRDNDLGYGILRVDEDQRWTPFFLFQPIWHVGNALLFEYSIAAYDLELGGYLAKKDRMSPEEKAKFRSDAKEVVAKIKRQATKDYVAHPALAAVTGSARTTLTANVVANLVRERVDQHRHHLRPLPARHRDVREDLDRGRDPRRVVPAPDARVGQHQRLARHAPHERQPVATRSSTTCSPTCRATATARSPRGSATSWSVTTSPTSRASLGKQAASVYWKVVELSLPNKVEGRRRRDIVRLALKKSWKKKSLGRF